MRVSRGILLAVVWLLPWSGLTPLSWLHPRAAWVDLLLLVAVASWAGATARLRAWSRPRPVHGAMGLYVGWGVVSLLAHGASPAAAAKVAGVALWVSAAVVTSALMRDSATRQAFTVAVEHSVALVGAGAGLGVLLSALGIETALVGTQGDLLPGLYARAQAGLSHPNLLGSYCLFATALVGGRDSRLRPRVRFLLLCIVAATAVLALSRAALALVVAIAIARAETPARRRLAAGLAAVVAGIYVMLTVLHPELDPTRPLAVRLATSPGPRRQAAATALRTLLDHPLVGSGPGVPPAVVGGLPFDAHLTPLNVAAGLGLPALAALAGIGVALFRARGRPTDRFVWGALAAIALDGLTQDVEDFRHVWILVGLSDAARDPEGARGASAVGAAPTPPISGSL